MVKLCGYFPGYCLKSGPCDLDVDSWPDSAKWDDVFKAAKHCPHRASKNPVGLRLVYNQCRRRDWKVGNPYKRE